MSKVFYSAANGGFYEEHVHGFRQVDVADPAWVRPVITVTLAPGETFGARTNTGKKPLVIKDVPDMDAVAPQIRVDNPDCKIPADAVEVTDAYRWELVNAQVTGKVIVANADGFPVMQDPPPPSGAELIALYEKALDRHLDHVAQASRYDNRFTFALRAGFPGPYHDEAARFASWMDECNQAAFALLESVTAGEAELPTLDAFLASLPVFGG